MKTQKGITLIALIITIIVMLILVGVSVSTAINTGLFKTASGVSQNTQGERNNELLISEGQANLDGTFTDINEYVQEINKKTEEILPGGVKIGDYVNYNCTDTEETIADYESKHSYNGSSTQTFKLDDYNDAWRVLGVNENGEIFLIAEDILETKFELYDNRGATMRGKRIK